VGTAGCGGLPVCKGTHHNIGTETQYCLRVEYLFRSEMFLNLDANGVTFSFSLVKIGLYLVKSCSSSALKLLPAAPTPPTSSPCRACAPQLCSFKTFHPPPYTPATRPTRQLLMIHTFSNFISAPSCIALACAAAAVIYIRHIRRDCRLSALWFVLCLITKALRPRTPARIPHASTSLHPPTPPDVVRSRESMRRLIRLAAPLMSYTPAPAHRVTLRRADACVAGVRVRWFDPPSSRGEKL
jgi:hypothetical protein